MNAACSEGGRLDGDDDPTTSPIAARPVLGGVTFNKAHIGMAATPDGAGYSFVVSDGGVFRNCDVGCFESALGAP